VLGIDLVEPVDALRERRSVIARPSNERYESCLRHPSRRCPFETAMNPDAITVNTSLLNTVIAADGAPQLMFTALGAKIG
jgi:hypothetical protein